MAWGLLVEAYAKRGKLDELHNLENIIVNEMKRQLFLLKKYSERSITDARSRDFRELKESKRAP